MHKPILAALAIMATLFGSAVTHAGGKSDWDGYGWKGLDITKCVAQGQTLDCPTMVQKWDWKRDQWVNVTVSVSGQAVSLTQRLINNDRRDRDDVCVTVLFLDQAGETIFVHHQNWDSHAASTMERQFSYKVSNWPKVTSIQLGSKQCRQGPHQDDAIFEQVSSGLSR